jgi:hypothetical protein
VAYATKPHLPAEAAAGSGADASEPAGAS